MLSKSDLKTWLHRDLAPSDKLLLVLSSFDKPCQVKDLKNAAVEAGFRMPKNWNVSGILGRTKGLAIRTPTGWEIAESGKQHLMNIGVSRISPSALHVATDLRSTLAKIPDDDTRAFVEEAIKCYELGLHRSAITMSWLAAVDVLHNHILKHHLKAFNDEAKRVDQDWKIARSTDDLGRMKESNLLDRLDAISVIGKNVKKELKGCLDRRNACGHPNSLKIGANTVAHHLEILLLNVFKVF